MSSHGSWAFPCESGGEVRVDFTGLDRAVLSRTGNAFADDVREAMADAREALAMLKFKKSHTSEGCVVYVRNPDNLIEVESYVEVA